MLQYDMPERADGRFHAGAEYAFSKFLALRAGFDDGTATFGLGVGAYNYGIDMAYFSKDGAGSTQAYAFTGAWGQTLDEKREAIAKQRAEEERALIQKTFDTRVQGMRKRAQEMETAGDYSGALAQWQVVLEFVPDDPEATAAAAEARERLLAEQAAAVRDVENQAIIRTRFAAGLDRYNERDFVGARTEWNAILAIDPQNEGAHDYLEKTNVKIDEIVRGHQAQRDSSGDRGPPNRSHRRVEQRAAVPPRRPPGQGRHRAHPRRASSRCRRIIRRRSGSSAS